MSPANPVSPPVVTVIICVRNGEATLRRQLEALDAQTGHPPFELVVVDNDSTDGTGRVIADWTSQDPHAADEIKVVFAPGRGGIPFARNRGIEAASGRIIAFCDADDRVDPGWVRAMADGTPEGGIAGGLILAELPDGTPAHDTFPTGLMGHDYLPYAANCNLAIDRGVIDAIGGYDESLPSYGYEDVDLSWRAHAAGLPVVFVPEAIVHMTLSTSRQSLRKRFLLGRGRILMADRYPAYDTHEYSVGTCTANVVRAGVNLGRNGLRASPAQRNRMGSELIDHAGRWWGCLRYRTIGHPPDRQVGIEWRSDVIDP